MKELLLVCIGSFFGGGARYLVGKTVQSLVAVSFPWGTMVVNVVGCFRPRSSNNWLPDCEIIENIEWKKYIIVLS